MSRRVTFFSVVLLCGVQTMASAQPAPFIRGFVSSTAFVPAAGTAPRPAGAGARKRRLALHGA